MGKRKSFDQWLEDEDLHPRKKPKPKLYKRKEMRLERALRRGDVDEYLNEEDEY